MRKLRAQSVLKLFRRLGARRFIHEIDESRVTARVDDEKATQTSSPLRLFEVCALAGSWNASQPTRSVAKPLRSHIYCAAAGLAGGVPVGSGVGVGVGV